MLRRHGRLWSIILLVMVSASAPATFAREIGIETAFDDAAAYQPLRLIDYQSVGQLRFEPDTPDPVTENNRPAFDDAPVFDNTPVFDDALTLEDDAESGFGEPVGLQVLPKDLLYRSYLAGEKEPRFQSVWLNETGRGRVWETQLGGRVGVLGYGQYTKATPYAWQLQMEGGAQARIDPLKNSDLEAVDFRFGILSTWRIRSNAIKAGYYHISSHAGDEYLLRHLPGSGFVRLNYVRDSAIIGITHFLNDDSQIYGEVAYAAGAEGGAKPLEFQYGYQYTPLHAYGLKGAPYFAINGHTRQDFNWITSVNTVAGWQWRGEETKHLWRVGLQYYTGPAIQWEFAGRNETLCGGGLWFDY